MKRSINFGAGPAKLPDEVLERIQKEFLCHPEASVSIIEMSHRSKEYKNIYNETVKLLREEMSIPNEYEVLFMHGGATGQFAAIPMNLKGNHESADYAVTGRWSLASFKEASKYIHAKEVFDVPASFTEILPYDKWKCNSDAAYLYYCANETVDGVEFKNTPETFANVPLVADVSSNILSRPFCFTNHAVVYGSTQKNLGAAGTAVVIVRKDLIKPVENIPAILSYHEMQRTASNYNTPNVFGIYVTKLVLEWIRNQGGLDVIERRNKEKAAIIYNVIDSSSGFYHSPVKPEFRSNMNIPFRIGGSSGNQQLEEKFLDGAIARGMIGLKGHRSVGGIRVSLYNAMTISETDALRKYMAEFQEKQR
uniref:phosphoserine transaminase n=1 Tax=Syphacia muris TaxID=451379 RepID=A0A0N5AQR2_9BILA